MINSSSKSLYKRHLLPQSSASKAYQQYCINNVRAGLVKLICLARQLLFGWPRLKSNPNFICLTLISPLYWGEHWGAAERRNNASHRLRYTAILQFKIEITATPVSPYDSVRQMWEGWQSVELTWNLYQQQRATKQYPQLSFQVSTLTKVSVIYCYIFSRMFSFLSPVPACTTLIP